mmetsp:Transcript_177532/g.569371  ORF Transcript_177532/g.569371 Transcript_177532/m.569371 type:complete len:255 (-) Transcript_177532:489-1253(-)
MTARCSTANPRAFAPAGSTVPRSSIPPKGAPKLPQRPGLDGTVGTSSPAPANREGKGCERRRISSVWSSSSSRSSKENNEEKACGLPSPSPRPSCAVMLDENKEEKAASPALVAPGSDTQSSSPSSSSIAASRYLKMGSQDGGELQDAPRSGEAQVDKGEREPTEPKAATSFSLIAGESAGENKGDWAVSLRRSARCPSKHLRASARPSQSWVSRLSRTSAACRPAGASPTSRARRASQSAPSRPSSSSMAVSR